MKNLPVFIVMPTIGALLLLAGCMSPPSVADRMRDHATAQHAQAAVQGQLAADWESGTRLLRTGNQRVLDGNRMIETAQRNLKKGQQLVQRGEAEIAKGELLVLESESQFRTKFPESSLSPLEK